LSPAPGSADDEYWGKREKVRPPHWGEELGSPDTAEDSPSDECEPAPVVVDRARRRAEVLRRQYAELARLGATPADIASLKTDAPTPAAFRAAAQLAVENAALLPGWRWGTPLSK